ncbi:hypothetical protein EV702DRAFT_972673, partial [Suillus placidus]
ALYALSGLLKLNTAAVQQMGVVGGRSALRMCLEGTYPPTNPSTLYDDDTHVRVNRLGNARPQKNNTPPILPLPSQPPTKHDPPTSETAPHTIHSNSHASMLSDPSTVSTSALMLTVIQEEGEDGKGGSLLNALISALIKPVSFGVDGEMDKDDGFQENVVKILCTFATSCNGAFSAVQKCSLWGFLGGIREMQLEGEKLNFGLTSGGIERCEVIV